MVAQAILHTEIPENHLKRANLTLTDGQIPHLSSFVTITKGSIKFFDIIKVSPSFLSKDPISWHDDKDYQAALKVVQNLTVVNDTSERAVQLATKCNDIITKNRYQGKQNPEIQKKNCLSNGNAEQPYHSF